MDLGKSIHVKGYDKKHFYYKEKALGVKFTSFTYGHAGYLTKWELATPTEILTGDTINEFVDTLYYLENELELTIRSKSSEDRVLVYTDDINRIYGFLKHYISHKFEKYCFVVKFFEFRAIQTFIDKEFNTAKEIAEYANNYLMKDFKEEKNVYLTPNQKVRAKLHKRHAEIPCDIYFPVDFYTYTYYRYAFYGNLCFIKLGRKEYHDIQKYDAQAAYTYQMLCKKHCSSKPIFDSSLEYEKYLDDEDKGFIGTFKLITNKYDNRLNYLKATEGGKLHNQISASNEDNDTLYWGTFILVKEDLKVILMVLDDIEANYYLECTSLEVYDRDYLPEYQRLNIIEAYYIKSDLNKVKHEHKAEYDQAKRYLHGNYGNSIQNCEDKDKFKHLKKKNDTNPIWGIETAAYAREFMIGLGLALDNFVYGNVDSFFMNNNHQNNRTIHKINKLISNRVKRFCEHFGYDFTKMYDLGKLQLEARYARFRANKPNQYFGLTYDGKFDLVCSGANKETVDMDPEFWFRGNTDYGLIHYIQITDKHNECTINGRHYVSESSYYDSQELVDPRNPVSVIKFALNCAQQ